jgi:hypothetical protein
MANKKHVYWVSAKGAPEEGNYYDCKNAIKKIIAQLKEPKIEKLDCGWSADDTPVSERMSDAGDVIRVLRNRNIFDDGPRVILLKGLPANYTILVDYLKFVNDKNYLVIDGPFGMRSKPPDQKFATAKSSNFYKEIVKDGHVVEISSDAGGISNAVKWCEKVSTELGKEIGADAAKKLAEMVGTKYDSLYSQLLRLVDYANGRKITEQDVEEACESEFLRTVWDLIDCIDKLDYESSIIHLQRFYHVASLDTDSNFIGMVEMLLGALRHHFLFCLMVADHCWGKKVSFGYKSVTDAVSRILSEDKDGKWNNKYFSPQFLGMAVRKDGVKSVIDWNRGRIYNAYLDINNVKAIVRTSPGIETIKVCLDTLIMVICNKISRTDAEKIRGSA